MPKVVPFYLKMSSHKIKIEIYSEIYKALLSNSAKIFLFFTKKVHEIMIIHHCRLFTGTFESNLQVKNEWMNMLLNEYFQPFSKYGVDQETSHKQRKSIISRENLSLAGETSP